MAPARILFPFTGESVGGSHISALTLARALDPTRYTPVIALHEPQGALQFWLEDRSIPWVKAPGVVYPALASRWRQVPRLGRLIPPLRAFLKEQQIALVHTQDIRMHLTWGAPARLTGRAFLWHQRTATRVRRHRGFGRYATGIAAISEYCAKTLPAEMSKRARVITNPVTAPDPLPDRTEAARALRKEIGGDDSRPILAFVANMAERKRPDLAIRTLSALLALGHQADLVLVGSVKPPFDQTLPALAASHGLADRVHLLGSRHPVEPLLAGADLLLAPALAEGWGRTLVEAMLVGTPVVAADDGGHREILRTGENGMLVPPDDVGAFAAAAARLLSQRGEAAELARAAQAEATSRYTVAAHVAAVTAFYDDLIG